MCSIRGIGLCKRSRLRGFRPNLPCAWGFMGSWSSDTSLGARLH